MNAPIESMDHGRIWSLWDMINFNFHHLMSALDLVQAHKANAYLKASQSPKSIVHDPIRHSVINNVEALGRICAELPLPSVDNRMDRIMVLFARNFYFEDLERELQSLIEAVEDDLKYERFFHYPKAAGQALLTVQGYWAGALKAFPQLRDQIEAAVDCNALGHNLGCAFYLMRIMEVGVQRIARRFKAPLTAKKPNKLVDLTWHQILDGLNPKLKALPQTTPAQKAKYERWVAVQSYLYAVKDAWRNPTMHPHVRGYTDLQGQDLINHVRAFMNGLGEALS